MLLGLESSFSYWGLLALFVKWDPFDFYIIVNLAEEITVVDANYSTRCIVKVNIYCQRHVFVALVVVDFEVFLESMTSVVADVLYSDYKDYLKGYRG